MGIQHDGGFSLTASTARTCKHYGGFDVVFFCNSSKRVYHYTGSAPLPKVLAQKQVERKTAAEVLVAVKLQMIRNLALEQ